MRAAADRALLVATRATPANQCSHLAQDAKKHGYTDSTRYTEAERIYRQRLDDWVDGVDLHGMIVLHTLVAYQQITALFDPRTKLPTVAKVCGKGEGAPSWEPTSYRQHR